MKNVGQCGDSLFGEDKGQIFDVPARLKSQIVILNRAARPLRRTEILCSLDEINRPLVEMEVFTNGMDKCVMGVKSEGEATETGGGRREATRTLGVKREAEGVTDGRRQAMEDGRRLGR